MVLAVRCEGREWLADVGFGGDGIATPIALEGGQAWQRTTGLGGGAACMPQRRRAPAP